MLNRDLEFEVGWKFCSKGSGEKKLTFQLMHILLLTLSFVLDSKVFVLCDPGGGDALKRAAADALKRVIAAWAEAQVTRLSASKFCSQGSGEKM